MTRHERIIIDLSLGVLRDAVTQASKGKVDTPGVRLALRSLLPHVAENWPLSAFWNAASGDHEIGRYQNCNASLNGIVLQLKAKGWSE